MPKKKKKKKKKEKQILKNVIINVTSSYKITLAKKYKLPRPGFAFRSPRPGSITITVTPSAPLSKLKSSTRYFWDCWIRRLHLCRGVKLPRKEFPGYYSKQSDDEASVMPELWGMQCTTFLPSLPGSLLPGVVAPNMALSMGQIELNCMLMLN